MKKIVALVLATMMMASAAVGCSSNTTTSTAPSTESKAADSAAAPAAGDVSVGVCIYKFDDTFMTGVRNNMAIVLAAAVLLSSLSACDSNNSSGKVETVKIGVTVYRKDDTFVTSLCAYLEKVSKEKETETGKKIVINIVDGQSSQALQNDQVDSFISQNYNVICVNMSSRLYLASQSSSFFAFVTSA